MRSIQLSNLASSNPTPTYEKCIKFFSCLLCCCFPANGQNQGTQPLLATAHSNNGTFFTTNNAGPTIIALSENAYGDNRHKDKSYEELLEKVENDAKDNTFDEDAIYRLLQELHNEHGKAIGNSHTCMEMNLNIKGEKLNPDNDVFVLLLNYPQLREQAAQLRNKFASDSNFGHTIDRIVALAKHSASETAGDSNEFKGFQHS